MFFPLKFNLKFVANTCDLPVSVFVNYEVVFILKFIYKGIIVSLFSLFMLSSIKWHSIFCNILLIYNYLVLYLKHKGSFCIYEIFYYQAVIIDVIISIVDSLEAVFIKS
jgi:hypothetical protein